MAQNKIIQQLANDLISIDDNVVLNALTVIRQKGDSSLVHQLVQLLNHSNPEITENAKKVLFDLKDKQAVNALLNEFDTIQDAGVRNIILQSLWQSNICPVNSISRLVQIAVSSNLEDCIEVYSIITNIIDEKIPESEIMESLFIINTNIDKIKDKHQKQLINDIAVFLNTQEH